MPRGWLSEAVRRRPGGVLIAVVAGAGVIFAVLRLSGRVRHTFPSNREELTSLSDREQDPARRLFAAEDAAADALRWSDDPNNDPVFAGAKTGDVVGFFTRGGELYAGRFSGESLAVVWKSGPYPARSRAQLTVAGGKVVVSDGDAALSVVDAVSGRDDGRVFLSAPLDEAPCAVPKRKAVWVHLEDGSGLLVDPKRRAATRSKRPAACGADARAREAAFEVPLSAFDAGTIAPSVVRTARGRGRVFALYRADAPDATPGGARLRAVDARTRERLWDVAAPPRGAHAVSKAREALVAGRGRVYLRVGATLTAFEAKTGRFVGAIGE